MFWHDCRFSVLHNLTANKSRNENTERAGRKNSEETSVAAHSHTFSFYNQMRLLQPKVIKEIYSPPERRGFLPLLGERGWKLIWVPWSQWICFLLADSHITEAAEGSINGVFSSQQTVSSRLRDEAHSSCCGSQHQHAGVFTEVCTHRQQRPRSGGGGSERDS